MLFQPFVENALIHSRINLADALNIHIRFYIHNNRIFGEVDDNGIGVEAQNNNGEAKKYKSVGIENVQRRLKILNEKYLYDFKLEIIDKRLAGYAGSGTLVIISFPILNEHL